MRILNRALIAAIAISLISVTASAQAQVFTEASFGGDFSQDANAPTDLGSLVAGVSTISGTSQSGNADRDHVTFTVDSGFEITAIQITEFDPSAGGGSFLGFDNSNVVPNSGGDFLFAGLVNVDSTGPALDIINGVVPDGGGFGGTGFSGVDLGAGDYSFLFNEVGAVNANYSAEITVAAVAVPEPGSAIVLAGLGLLAAGRRRKR